MEFMIAKLLGIVMVLTRISAFFLVVPVFSSKVVPVRIKLAGALLLTIFFSMVHPFGINATEVSVPQAILYISNEAIYGFGLGLIAALVFSAVKFCGRIVERQMGLAMAQILDPMTGERAQFLGLILEMIFILMFLAANGHHILLLVISRSYEAFPAGSIPTIPILTAGVTKAGATMLIAGLRLSAPILAAFLLLLVTLAILARITPEMNILFISLPLRVGVGLFMVMTFLPFINGFVSEFSDWMGKLLPL